MPRRTPAALAAVALAALLLGETFPRAALLGGAAALGVCAAVRSVCRTLALARTVSFCAESLSPGGPL